MKNDWFAFIIVMAGFLVLIGSALVDLKFTPDIVARFLNGIQVWYETGGWHRVIVVFSVGGWIIAFSALAGMFKK